MKIVTILMGINIIAIMIGIIIGIYPLVSSNVAGRWKIPELNGGLNERFICKWWIFQQAMLEYLKVELHQPFRRFPYLYWLVVDLPL